MVDAVWLGLLGRYAAEYASLKPLELVGFAIAARGPL